MAGNTDSGHYAGHARVHGLDMYYEVHGEGQSLVLLHGALSSIGTSFGKLLPELARQRRVIAVEMQGHGRTADIDRPLRYELLADDIAALLTQIGIEQADLFGWSLGAGVALQTAIRHPERVRKLVLASVTYNSAGLSPSSSRESHRRTPRIWPGLGSMRNTRGLHRVRRTSPGSSPDSSNWTPRSRTGPSRPFRRSRRPPC